MIRVKEIAGTDIIDVEQFQHQIVERCSPVILRGLVKDWPVVQAGLQSPEIFRDHVMKFDVGSGTEAFFGDPQIAGKYYYNDDLKGFNFERRRMKFRDALDTIVSTIDKADAHSCYVGSIPVDNCLPGFSTENHLSLLPSAVGARIWLGHASTVSTHYDAFENLACVIAGTRRFSLFPPEYIRDLYVGPIDNTMAGQPVSLAASSSPDDIKYPLFREIKDKMMIAELNPGDALFLPKLWWHKVESIAPFNGLINYWWDAFSSGPDAPYTGMLLSMITLAERPLPERLAWRAYFDHYVFRPNGHPLQHLSTDQHGLLGPLKETYGKLRARVMQLLRSV